MKTKKNIWGILLCLVMVGSLSGLPAQPLDQWLPLGPYTEWPFPFSRHEHAFVEANGKMYMIGGRGNKPVQIYDPQTNTWEMGAQPPLEIHHMQLVHLNGKIYVICAQTGPFPHEDPVGNVLIYDIASDSWQWGPSIPQHRQRGSAGAVLYNGKIYVVCGIIDGHSSGWVNWLDVFDPATNSWQQLPDAPRARDHFHAALVGDKIVVAGGRRSGANGYFNATIGEVDVYDISDNSWSTISSIPTQRAGCSAVAIGNEVVVMGGESGGQQAAHNQVQALNIQTGSWRSLDPLNQGRHGFQATIYNNAIYVAGGSIEKGANELSNTDPNYVEVYHFDPPQDMGDDDDDDGPQPPQASISSSALSGPAPLTVVLDAGASSDPDGQIVEYGWDLGDGSSGQGQQLTHTYAVPGTYTVTLTVMDNDSLSDTESLEITAFDPNLPRILFVAESVGGDATLVAHLQSEGFEVTTKSAQEVTLEDALDKSLVIISSTVLSSQVGTRFTQAAVPVINWEPALYDDLLMVAPGNGQLSGWMNEMSIDIADASHPLAAGDTGSINLFSTPQSVSWAMPGGQAARVGISSSMPERSMLFAFEAGDSLPGGGLAPARRVGLPFGDQSANQLTAAGWRLFDVAVCWAMDCNPIQLRAEVQPTSGTVPLQVQFDASASRHLYGNISQYSWNFGDSTLASSDTVTSHTYQQVGSYQASLTLTDEFGFIRSDTFEIEVLPAPPTAVWTAGGDSTLAPAVVRFDARSSSDVDGEIVAYYWAYGDGTTDSLLMDSLPVDTTLTDSLLLDSLLQPTHTYPRAGTYLSILTVKDNDGALASDSLSIVVLNNAPLASLLADTASGLAPLQVQFDARASADLDGDLVQYHFDFGDGTDALIPVDSNFSDSLLMPLHTYTRHGSYLVSLVVTDNLGAQDTAALEVQVVNQAPLAVATASTDSGLAPLTVLFSAESSTDVDGDIVAYSWMLPGGATDSADMTSFDFLRWGDYQVYLQVTDDGGLSSTDTVSIHIANQAPVAVASADRLWGNIPFEVQFDGAASSDIDGDIVAYSWTINGQQFAADAQFSYVFQDTGLYQVVLTVTDDAGATHTQSLQIEALPEARDVLFVVGNINLNPSDARIVKLLEDMNFVVHLAKDELVQTADAEDKVLVLVSSTSHSGSVNNKFRDVAIPFICWEPYIYDDMMMTGNVQGIDYLNIYGASSLEISDAQHPLAAGLSGTVQLFEGNGVLSWGNPSAEAARVAHAPGDPSKWVVFAYESGSQMVGMPAPARRAGLFFQDNEAIQFTPEAISLFEAAVCWAVGCSGLSPARALPQERKMPAHSAKVFPVPATDVLHLEFVLSHSSAVEWKLLDLSGRILRQRKFHLPGGNYSQRIEVSQLPAGVYQLLLQSNEEQLIKKVVIQ